MLKTLSIAKLRRQLV